MLGEKEIESQKNENFEGKSAVFFDEGTKMSPPAIAFALLMEINPLTADDVYIII